MSNYRIRSGDTLSKIARRNNTTVERLARDNNIRDPNKIVAGNNLEIRGRQSRPTARPEQTPPGRPTARPEQTAPGRPTARPEQTAPGRPTARPEQTAPQSPTTQAPRDVFTPNEPPRTGGANRTWTDPANPNKRYESRDGVPRFNQGDPDWESRRLGGSGTVAARDRNSVQSQGCAISSTAMAISALSGRTITPAAMDQYLDNNRGYSGNSVDFNRTGGVTGGDPRITATRQRNLSVNEIDRQLDAGRPVVIGVNYGSSTRTAPHHWVTITGRNPDGSYRANDPNGGGTITLRREGNNGLMAPANGTPRGVEYHFRNQGVTFAGGTPVRPAQGNGQDVYTDNAPQAQTRPTTRPRARPETPRTEGGTQGQTRPTTRPQARPETPRTGGTQGTQATGGTRATGGNAILNDLQTTGASAETSRQDGPNHPTGVAGSHRMAETDRGRLERYREMFQQVGAEYGLPPALLAAIASRESRGGGALRDNGYARFDPNGYGLMQIDRAANRHLIRGGPTSREHVATAANLLRENLAAVRRAHPDWTPAQQLRGAVAAYNMDPSDVRTLAGMDRGSTGNDYSADIWARAQYLAGRGF